MVSCGERSVGGLHSYKVLVPAYCIVPVRSGDSCDKVDYRPVWMSG